MRWAASLLALIASPARARDERVLWPAFAPGDAGMFADEFRSTRFDLSEPVAVRTFESLAFVVPRLLASLVNEMPARLVVPPSPLIPIAAEGVTLATNFSMNWSIRSSPVFFRNVLVMLTTIATIGMRASRLT